MKASNTLSRSSRFNPLNCSVASTQRTSPPRTPVTPTPGSPPDNEQTVKMSGRTFSIDMPTYNYIPSSASRRMSAAPQPVMNESLNTGRTRTVTSAYQQTRLTELLAEVCAFRTFSEDAFSSKTNFAFPQTAFPTTKQREDLGNEIGMSGRRVQVCRNISAPALAQIANTRMLAWQVWFQNRRQAYKRKKDEMMRSNGSELSHSVCPFWVVSSELS